MFTGIIQSVVPILSLTPSGECLRVRMKKPAGWKLTLGQSVAVDGVCSTVIAQKTGFFEVDYMPETLAKTTVKTFKKNTLVNLERSLTLRDALDGGLIQGHVDIEGVVQTVEIQGKTRVLTIVVPAVLKKYIALKGSIVVNGVSLTVALVKKNTFSVALIPYTLTHTNLKLLKRGDRVNIEVDILARYVVAALEGLNRK